MFRTAFYEENVKIGKGDREPDRNIHTFRNLKYWRGELRQIPKIPARVQPSHNSLTSVVRASHVATACMQATAVGYQSVDRWSVHTCKGRKEEAGEEARANVERTLRQGGGRRRRRERGSSEKDGRGFFICIVGTRHIQFARSSKIAGLVRRSDREVRRKRNKGYRCRQVSFRSWITILSILFVFPRTVNEASLL